MKKNIQGESLVSILIAVFIISISIISFIKISEFDNQINSDYEKINNVDLLEKNTSNIIKSIKTLEINENEIFYIKKGSNAFLITTGSVNEGDKFVDKFGNNINPINSTSVVYTRICLLEKDSSEGQIIKCSIKEMTKK